MRHLLVSSGIILLLDQMSKLVIYMTMFEKETISVWKDIIKITYIKNKGAVFGLFVGHGFFFTAATLFVIIAILLSYRRLRHQDRWIELGEGLILGGATGNLIDRLRFGGVIDFLDIGLGVYRWPVFNLADVGICLGVGMLIYRGIKRRTSCIMERG